MGRTATVTISGGGSGTVNVSGTLDVTISGLGSLKYKGYPQVNQKITGGGSVQQVP